jgi:hypothetical protein
LKDELIGKEDREEGEEEVDPSDGVERALPRPFSDEDFFPIHGGKIDSGTGVQKAYLLRLKEVPRSEMRMNRADDGSGTFPARIALPGSVSHAYSLTVRPKPRVLMK